MSYHVEQRLLVTRLVTDLMIFKRNYINEFSNKTFIFERDWNCAQSLNIMTKL